MADIVQLVENGVKQYLKTHVKAVEGLSTELSNYEQKNSLVSGTVLWRGNSTLNESHTVSLSNGISECENGILFIFCPLVNEPINRLWVSHFYSKHHKSFSGESVTIPLVNAQNGSSDIYKVVNFNSDKIISGLGVNVNAKNITMTLVAVIAV